jgi:hypothetical protein
MRFANLLRRTVLWGAHDGAETPDGGGIGDGASAVDGAPKDAGTDAACGTYDVPCTPGSCCDGLTCDSVSAVCLVAAGGSCNGGFGELSCATPDTCLDPGICGPGPCGMGGNDCSTTRCCYGYICGCGTVCHPCVQEHFSCMPDQEPCCTGYSCVDNGLGSFDCQ